MTQYNTLNVKLSNSQFNELQFGIKNGTKVTLNISSNLIGNSNDETSFPLLLVDTQVPKIRKTFANGSWGNIIVLIIHLSKLILSGWYIGMLNPINPITPNEVMSKTRRFIWKRVTIINIIKWYDRSSW